MGFNLFDNRRRCPDAEFTEITWHFEGEFATERSVTAVGVHFLARDQLFSYARKLVVGGYEPNAQSQEDRKNQPDHRFFEDVYELFFLFGQGTHYISSEFFICCSSCGHFDQVILRQPYPSEV